MVTQQVFSTRDGRFQYLNILHRSTRKAVLERELLFKPLGVGDKEDRPLLVQVRFPAC